MSSDLDARIRAKLDSMVENYGAFQSCAGCEGDCYCQMHVDYQNAILAVLELKRRTSEDWTHFDETAYELGQRMALEEAVSAIGEALGIKAEETAAERLEREGCEHETEPFPGHYPEIRCRKCGVIVGENGPRFDDEKTRSG